MAEIERVLLGDITYEYVKRSGSREDIPVYGVDKNVGLTSEPRYQSKDLSRYKRIEQGMFAYNPMRLNIGSIGYCNADLPPGIVSPDYVVFGCKEEILSSKFLNYHTETLPWKNWLKFAGEGSVRERIYFRKLAKYEIELPSIFHQKSSVEILEAFDRKIELNRRINETLEAMTQAIFRDWFVDFGPVHRKATNAAPTEVMGGLFSDAAHAANLANLFPDALDHEGRPPGWRYLPLSGITTQLRRGITPKYVGSGGLVVLNQKCIRNQEVSFASSRRHDPSAKSILGRTLEKGDVLVNSTGVGTLGRVAQIWNIDEPVVADSHITVVRADPNCVSTTFLGIALRQREPEIVQLGEGSTGQTELSREQLGQLQILVPESSIAAQFDALCCPLVACIEANRREIAALFEARDYLLPRLVAGAVGIADAPIRAGSL